MMVVTEHYNVIWFGTASEKHEIDAKRLRETQKKRNRDIERERQRKILDCGEYELNN